MENKDTFSGYNPIINFVFFIGAVVFGMFFVHPVFMMCSLLLASVFLCHGEKICFMEIPDSHAAALCSTVFGEPAFQYQWFHRAFYIFGRQTVYSSESLYYGMVLAVMFISVIIWFASYNIVMTTDKFLYIFGKAAPSISLVLSMIMRLVPGFQKKIGQISSARKCIRKGGGFRDQKRKGRKQYDGDIHLDQLGSGGRYNNGRQHEEPRIRIREEN